MRRFRYLIQRVTDSRLNGLMALIFLGLFIQAVLAPAQFSFKSLDIVQLKERGHGSFQFITGMGKDLLLPKYDQGEYIRDLNRYLSWLRSEIALTEATPEEDVWLGHLKSQQEIHNQKLRVVTGVTTPESYYLNHYLEPLLSGSEFTSALFPIRADDSEWQRLLETVLKRDLTSESPMTRVKAMNILEELPLRPDSNSATSLTLDLRSTGKILLLLVPFLTFLVVFTETDRNLRKQTPLLSLEKTLAVFLYSAAALILIFGLLYLFLRIRHGDSEGAMYVIPFWNEGDSQNILTLNRLLLNVMAMDLVFLLFASLLLTTLRSILKDPWASGLAALGLLLLPSLITSPFAFSDRLFTPFHYFQWGVSPKSFSVLSDRMQGAYTAELPAAPGEVLTALTLGGMALIVVSILSHWITERRKTLALKKPKERASL